LDIEADSRRTTKTQLINLLAQRLLASGKRLFSPSDLTEILAQSRAESHLPKSLTKDKLLALAIETKTLLEIQLSVTYPLHTTRYHVGKFTANELALSLRPGSYLCHGTAAFLHGVAANHPDFIYANQEQSPKEHSGSLTQAGLNKAFSSKQRQSNFIVSYEQTNIMLLSGKHTNRLGVQKIVGTAGDVLEVTNLERTLIDIAVRPGHAGGTENVLQSYRRAIQKTSAEHLAEMLTKLDYVYPYHQAIGFYLQRAGYDSELLVGLRMPGLKYDFFLAHGMKKTKFDEDWRVHYPDDLSKSG
jgi:hypothetical protein